MKDYKDMNIEELKEITTMYDEIYNTLTDVDMKYEQIENKESEEAIELAHMSQSYLCSLESLVKKENRIKRLIAKKVKRVYALDQGYIIDSESIYNAVSIIRSLKDKCVDVKHDFEEICNEVRRLLEVDNLLTLIPMDKEQINIYKRHGNSDIEEYKYPLQIILFDIKASDAIGKYVGLTAVEDNRDEKTGECCSRLYVNVEM